MCAHSKPCHCISAVCHAGSRLPCATAEARAAHCTAVQDCVYEFTCALLAASSQACEFQLQAATDAQLCAHTCADFSLARTASKTRAISAPLEANPLSLLPWEATPATAHWYTSDSTSRIPRAHDCPSCWHCILSAQEWAAVEAAEPQAMGTRVAATAQRYD